MSHFTTVSTKIEKKNNLLKALKDLGYEPNKGDTVDGYQGNRTKADIVVPTSNRGYDIGFVKNSEGSYDIVADWWGINSTSKDTFVNEVTQRYSYHTTLEETKKKGFNLASEEVKDGQIRLVLRRMA